MSREVVLFYPKLLHLLEEHVRVADLWEAHLRRGMRRGGYPDKVAEEHAHLEHQRLQTIPLMEKCRAMGLNYIDILDIIPGPFKTTPAERAGLLRVLEDYVLDEMR